MSIDESLLSEKNVKKLISFVTPVKTISVKPSEIQLQGNIYMNATNQLIAKFSRLIFFIIVALAVCSRPSFCEGSEVGVSEEITDKQAKSYINEFQSVFGKQMEREFNLTLIEGGFLRNFSIGQYGP